MYIIAEIGQTHEGSVNQCIAFIDAIKKAGANAVKFQMHIADEESSPNEEWRTKFSFQDATRYDYWKRMEFSLQQWQTIRNYAKEKKLDFICSPFSEKAVDYLSLLNVDAWKVGSGEVTSDIDFVTAIDDDSRVQVKEKLEKYLEFRGERIARKTSTRYLFCMKYNGYHIDLNVMTKTDYDAIIQGMYTMKKKLSPQKKKEIISHKKELKEMNKINEYELYKNSFYQIYCPDFIWIADDEIIKNIAKQFIEAHKELPMWLQNKLSTEI